MKKIIYIWSLRNPELKDDSREHAIKQEVQLTFVDLQTHRERERERGREREE